MAKEYNVTRDDQDAFALNSQQKTKQAMENGCFKDEIVSVTVKGRRGATTEVAVDEHPRPETNLDGLKKLRPAFATDGTGSVTAGNASGLNDGAAAVLVMSSHEAHHRGLQPLAKIVAFGTAGVRPDIMGMGPVPAIKKAVRKCNSLLCPCS